MRTIHVLPAALAAAFLATACRGLVAPGRTTGDTYGGPWSAQFAKKDAPTEAPKEAKAAKASYPSGPPGPHDRANLVTRVNGDKTWVFRDKTKEWADYLKSGEPGKSAFLVGAGPAGGTLWGPDLDTVQSWAWSRPGYEVFVRDGTLWVARAESLDALWLRTGGTPGKHAFLIGSGPDGATVYAGDLETAEAYAKAASY